MQHSTNQGTGEPLMKDVHLSGIGERLMEATNNVVSLGHVERRNVVSFGI